MASALGLRGRFTAAQLSEVGQSSNGRLERVRLPASFLEREGEEGDKESYTRGEGGREVGRESDDSGNGRETNV